MDMNENDERPHHVFIYPTTIHTNRRSSSRRKSAASRTLTTLDYDSERFLQAENDMERDLDELIALKNREELEEIYEIPFIVTFIISHFFSPPGIYLRFVLSIAHPRGHLMIA